MGEEGRDVGNCGLSGADLRVGVRGWAPGGGRLG